MNLDDSIYDIIEYGTKITYELELPVYFDGEDADFSLSFDLEPYYGTPELYINYQFAPDSLDLYTWHIKFDDD